MRLHWFLPTLGVGESPVASGRPGSAARRGSGPAARDHREAIRFGAAVVPQLGALGPVES